MVAHEIFFEDQSDSDIFYRQIYYKEVKLLIDITKDEAEYLVSKGRSHDIHLSSRTHKSGSKTRFVTESPKTMKLLRDYRRKRIISTYDGG